MTHHVGQTLTAQTAERHHPRTPGRSWLDISTSHNVRKHLSSLSPLSPSPLLSSPACGTSLRTTTSSIMASEFIDPRMTSIKPHIRYNTIGGINGPLVVLDNVRRTPT